MKQWHYAKHGRQEGPVELAALLAMIQDGQLSSTDLVWREGMPEWTPAGKVPELNPNLAVPPPQVAPPVLPPGAAGQNPTPSQPTAGRSSPQQIPNSLVPAILAALFCCQPFGIVAIVFAVKVDSLRRQGDIPGAIEAANSAKQWTTISIFLGVLSYLVWIVVALFIAAGKTI